MDAIYIDNTPRECGQLVPGGYYLSSADMFSADGALNIVAYPFGDGLDDVLLCGSMPSRGMVEVNPAASFSRLSLIAAGDPFEPAEYEADMYGRLTNAVTRHGLFDHVGDNNYTPSLFIKELIERGPNRHVTPEFARRIALLLPLPVFFTTKLPVFRSSSELTAVMDIAESLIDGFHSQARYLGANWGRESWGMYASENQDPGRDHFMLAVLGLMHKVHKRNWHLVQHDPYWKDVRAFMDSLTYEEQPFVASWMLRAIKIVEQGEEATYTAADEKDGIIPAIPTSAQDFKETK